MFSLCIFGIIVLMIGLISPVMPSSAQGSAPTDADELPVSVTLSGKITSLTKSALTLDDDSVVTINKHTDGLTSAIKVGVTVTVEAEVDNDEFVAKTITLGASDDSEDDATVSPTPAATDSQTVGKGKGKDKGKGNPQNSQNDSGKGKGNGKGKGPKGKPTPAATKDHNDHGSKDQKGCLANQHHPVALRLSKLMDESYADIMAWHCDGNGFGEILRAYLISQKTDMSVDELLQMHKDGEGWGKIMKDADLKPSDLNLKIHKGKKK
jgi:hypothetical protein